MGLSSNSRCSSSLLKMPASFVLGSQTSSTYPKGTPPVFATPAASLAEHFEQPA
jgi:hypothetical protein